MKTFAFSFRDSSSKEVFLPILTFYSSLRQLAGKLEEKLAIRILCLFVR